MSILCVDDEPSVSMIVEHTLREAGHETVAAKNVPEALQKLALGGVELIISDYKMPGLSGLEFLELLTSEGFDIPLIMLTGYASIEHAVASIKAGAVDYITKPVRPEQLKLAVEQALELVRLRKENATLRREMSLVRNERQILGDSAVMRHALQSVATAAPTRATVLLLGESGTGKELFARAIHDMSDRHDKPFIKLNCAALPEGLIESALFGHEKGAFTGAIKRVEGAFERANRGTLLLDEISEMRLDLQAKILRVLQEQEFERVGRHEHHSRRCESDRDIESRSRRRCDGRPLPAGSLLQAERDSAAHSRAARATRGHTDARLPIRDAGRARGGQVDHDDRAGGDPAPAAVSVAGERARARARRRARRHSQHRARSSAFGRSRDSDWVRRRTFRGEPRRRSRRTLPRRGRAESSSTRWTSERPRRFSSSTRSPRPATIARRPPSSSESAYER